MKLRLKSIARLFFRKKEKRMQTKVRPSSKSPTKSPAKLPCRHEHATAPNGAEYSTSTTSRSTTLSHSSSSSSTSSSSSSSTSKSAADITKKKELCCDKCDGKHETNQCPFYKTKRGNHPDEQRNGSKLGGVSSLPGQTLRSARVIRQPGDGSCLFHSMSYGACVFSAIVQITDCRVIYVYTIVCYHFVNGFSLDVLLDRTC